MINKRYFSRSIIILLFILLTITLPVFSSYYWTENTEQDFKDGYFFRSTVTADGKLQIRQWDDWWNTDWPQRIPIEINTTGITETLYDYQIWFITDTKSLVDANKLDQNGTAIRITGPDGKTLIPFWVENWNVTTSTGSKIWVKVPQIPPNTKSYIYMYIRNVSTNSLSDRDQVFDLYEDWESGQILPERWQFESGIRYSTWTQVRDWKYEIHMSTDVLYYWFEGRSSTQTLAVYEGRYCIRNSTIPDSGDLYAKSFVDIFTSVNLPRRSAVEFVWACYSEPRSGDYGEKFQFFIGGESKASISGNQYWILSGPFVINGGATYSFRWRYEKDHGGILYFDRGFLDKIVIRKYNDNLYSSFQMSSRVQPQEIESWSEYYTYAEYRSNVYDTYGENTLVVYSSWSEVLNGQTVKVYARCSDTLFGILDPTPEFILLNNNSSPGSNFRGRYLQYKVEFISSGSSTPVVTDINFSYEPLPLRAYNFNGIALSSTSIMWTWTPRATYYPAIEYIDGYRIYSATRAYNKDGGYLVITSTSDGLLAELPPDATYWIEDGLLPNTTYSRYVVAYTTTVVEFGGNASRRWDNKDMPAVRCSFAMVPELRAEKYRQIEDPPNYEFVEISTEVWYSTIQEDPQFKPNWFSFTSPISSGPGRVAYYKCVFSTSTEWNDSISFVWYPSSYTYGNEYQGSIIERPIIFTTATFNSDSWYLQVKSYNMENVSSDYRQILGPFRFKGCPTQITDLTASRGKGEEGCVILTWTAPSDDMDGGNLQNANYVIKYRTVSIIDNITSFDSITPVSTSTGMVSGVVEVSTNNVIPGSQQTFIVTGLVPGLTYWFAIVTVDQYGNRSPVSTNITDLLLMRSRSSKVARIVFDTPSYTFYAGDVSPPIRVKLVDEDGDEIKSKFGAECNLLTTSNRGSFSRNGIDFGINKLYFDIGDSNAIFYYKDENAGSPTITVDEIAARYYWNGEQGWLSGQQIHTILPGKAVGFRVVPEDGSYNCQIQATKKAYVEAVDKLGNTAVDFEGVAVVTTSFSGASVVPSYVTFMSTHQGKVLVELYNDYYAGASSYTVYEIVDQDFRKLIFTDINNGYIVGSKGMLKATSEGGQRWFTKIYGNTSSRIFNSISVSGNTGIICGENGLVVRSTDNFISYTEQTIDTVGLKDSIFVTLSTIVICGGNGKVFKSTDAGVSFETILTPVSETLNSVTFVNTSTGYFCGNNGVILKSTDTAGSFVVLSSAVYSNLYGMKFLNEQIGYFCGSNNTVLKTVDAGETFSLINVPLSGNVTFYCLDFITEQAGVVCGSSGTVLVTTNGTDFVDKSPAGFHQENFYGVKMFSYDRILVVGSNGNILYTADRGDTWQKIVMQGRSPQDYLWNATIISSFVVTATEGEIIQGEENKVTRLGIRLAYPTNITTRIDRVKIYKFGSLPDGYISSISFGGYSASFVNNIAEIPLPNLPITNATSYFDVKVTLSRDAPLDTTLGLKFDFDSIRVSQGVQFGRNNLPLETPEFLVVPPVVNVYIVDIDTMVYLRTGEVQVSTTPVNFLEQGDYAVTVKLGLRTERSKSPFRKLRVRLTGDNLRDEDIKQISLYKDFPFIYENHLASTVFSGGFAVLEFDDKNIKLDYQTTYYFYLTVEVSPEASYTREGTEVNFSFIIDISTSWFILDPKGDNSITSLLTNIQNQIRSYKVRIEPARDIVSVKPLTDIIARISFSVYQSERIILLPLGVSVGKRGMGTASASWLKLQVDKSTTAADNYTRFDRSSSVVAELWKDDGDGLLNPTRDIFISAGTFENNTAVILFPQPETISVQTLEGYTTYFVICYVPKNAKPQDVLQFRISNASYLTLAGIDEVDGTYIPLVSPEVKIEDYPDEVEATFVSLAETEAALYETDFPIARVDLLAYCDATLDKLTLLAEGTAMSSTTISHIKVYLDDGDHRFNKDKDVLISTGTFTEVGKCELTFFNPENKLKYKPVLVLDETVRLFIVADFNENAVADKTFGIGVSHENFVYNLPNRQKTFGYFSTGKTLLLDKRTPTKPVIKPAVPLDGGIDTGLEVANIVYYTPQVNQIKFKWYSEAKYGSIKSGYCAIATRKPTSSNDQPDLINYKETTTVGDFSLSGLNLEHGKVYYLWVKAENADGGFARVNYVPIFVDRTEPQPPLQPETNLSTDIFWLNSKIIEDNESFVNEIIIEERKHQEYLWRPVKSVSIPLQELVRQLNEGRLVSTKNSSGKIVFSSRTCLSDDTVVVYTFTVSTQTKQDVEPVNFNTLFAKLGYNLENVSIKLEQKFTLPQEKKFYYYRVKSKNVAGLYSSASSLSSVVYSFVPDDLIIELTTFPNPCDVRKKNLTVCYILSKDAEVKLRFFDLFGKQVGEKFIPLGSDFGKLGVNFLELEDSKDFATGMYILLMEAKDKNGKIERKKWKFGIIR